MFALYLTQLVPHRPQKVVIGADDNAIEGEIDNGGGALQCIDQRLVLARGFNRSRQNTRVQGDLFDAAGFIFIGYDHGSQPHPGPGLADQAQRTAEVLAVSNRGQCALLVNVTVQFRRAQIRQVASDELCLCIAHLRLEQRVDGLYFARAIQHDGNCLQIEDLPCLLKHGEAALQCLIGVFQMRIEHCGYPGQFGFAICIGHGFAILSRASKLNT